MLFQSSFGCFIGLHVTVLLEYLNLSIHNLCSASQESMKAKTFTVAVLFCPATIFYMLVLPKYNSLVLLLQPHNLKCQWGPLEPQETPLNTPLIASSALVECAFSTAGECTSTKRNRLANQNLETEVLKNNKHYFVLHN